jgi:hypothetical protein
MRKNITLVSGARKTGYYAANTPGADIVPPAVFQIWIDGNSGVTGTVKLYGSNDPRAVEQPDIAAQQLLSTITFTGSGGGLTPPESAIVPIDLPYMYYITQVTAISGTNAAVTVVAGVMS